MMYFLQTIEINKQVYWSLWNLFIPYYLFLILATKQAILGVSFILLLWVKFR